MDSPESIEGRVGFSREPRLGTGGVLSIHYWGARRGAAPHVLLLWLPGAQGQRVLGVLSRDFSEPTGVSASLQDSPGRILLEAGRLLLQGCLLSFRLFCPTDWTEHGRDARMGNCEEDGCSVRLPMGVGGSHQHWGSPVMGSLQGTPSLPADRVKVDAMCLSLGSQFYSLALPGHTWSSPPGDTSAQLHLSLPRPVPLQTRLAWESSCSCSPGPAAHAQVRHWRAAMLLGTPPPAPSKNYLYARSPRVHPGPRQL